MQPLPIAGHFDAEYNRLDPALNHARVQQSLIFEIVAQQLLVTWSQLFALKLARTELLEQLGCLVEVALLQFWLVAALLHVFIQIPQQLVAALELVPPIAQQK